MESNTKIILKITGLELLLIIFYTANGAYVTMTLPSSPTLQYIGILPLAIGVFIYLVITKKWKDYFSVKELKANRVMMLLCAPLLLVLLIVFIGHKGLNTTSLSDLLPMFIMQLFVIAFTEEIFFRGFMLWILLLSKGFKIAVMISSFLFAMTHSLQLLGGQSLEETIIQITYAFLVGMVLSLLIINNQSIIIAIAFHGLNNFFQTMMRSEGSSIFGYVIIVILIAHAIFLWKRANTLSNIEVFHVRESNDSVGK